MNQTLSWATFTGGLMGFLTTATELLKDHNSWSYFYQTPLGAVHFIVLGGFFVAMIAGALGVQLPRKAINYGERKDDPPATVEPKPKADG